MEKNVTIYINMPVYNADSFLRTCLESVKVQTYPNFVCVMVDDGSTDSSNEICKEYTKDNRFVLLKQENQGVGAARRTALNYILENASENDFMTFLDADDTIKQDFFERFITTLKNNATHSKTTLYLSGYNEINGDKTITHLHQSNLPVVYGDFRQDMEILDSFLQTLWKNFYNLSLIKEHNLNFDPYFRRTSDIAFDFEYAFFVDKYVFINECFYNYYNISTSVSHGAASLTEEAFEIMLKSFKKRVHFLTEFNIPCKDRVLNKHISILVFKLIHTSWYKRLYELKQYANPSDTRNSGEKRVIFCLTHNMLWVYRLYLKCKALFIKP